MTRRFDALVTATRASGATQALVMAAAAMAIVVIGLTDYVTGITVSSSVFYFIPVTAVTVAVSPAAGFGLSAIAAVAWTLADTFKIDSTPVLQVWNGLFRFCALSFVVALLAALRRALREAQASERRSKEFLANAAHQLRTPVAAVRASAEALGLTAGKATPAQRERLASNLTIEAERMGRLVRSLLRLTRLDQGDPLEPGPCDVEPARWLSPKEVASSIAPVASSSPYRRCPTRRSPRPRVTSLRTVGSSGRSSVTGRLEPRRRPV